MLIQLEDGQGPSGSWGEDGPTDNGWVGVIKKYRTGRVLHPCQLLERCRDPAWSCQDAALRSAGAMEGPCGE